MRGYSDLSFFRELDFAESWECYTHLLYDRANEVTLEAITKMIEGFTGNTNDILQIAEKADGKSGGAKSVSQTNADAFFDMYF
jgi:hypothetical protein